MPRIQIKTVSAVGVGITSIFTLPVGWRYKTLTLVAGLSTAGNGNAPAIGSIGEIRLNYLGGIQRRLTATQLDAINTQNGAQYASTQAVTGGANGTGRRNVPIFLDEPWRNLGDADSLGWQTGFFGKSDKFLLEVDNVTNNVLTLFADVDEFNGGKPHPIIKWDKHQFNAVGTPLAAINELDARDSYTELDIFDTSDAKTIEAVRLTQGTKEIFNLSKPENATSLKVNDMNPAAGLFGVVFDIHDHFRSIVPARSLTLEITTSAAAAGTVDIIGQRIGLPE